MTNTIGYKLNSINLKSYKRLSACLLIFLIVLSSCGVRKGIQYFLSNDTVSSMQSGKLNKIICEQRLDTKTNLHSLVSQHDSVNSTSTLLYLLLPAFLISLITIFNGNLQLPVPESLLHCIQLPLFLQNRLLLI